MNKPLPPSPPRIVDLRMMVVPCWQPYSPRRSSLARRESGYLNQYESQWVNERAFTPGARKQDTLDPDSFRPAWWLPRIGDLHPDDVAAVEAGTVDAAQGWAPSRRPQWPAVRVSSETAQVVFVLGHDVPFHEALISIVPALRSWLDDAHTEHTDQVRGRPYTGTPTGAGWSLLDRIVERFWPDADADARGNLFQWRSVCDLVVLGIESGLTIYGEDLRPVPLSPTWADRAVAWSKAHFPFQWSVADDQANVCSMSSMAIATGHPPEDLQAWMSCRIPMRLSGPARAAGYTTGLLDRLREVTDARHDEQDDEGSGHDWSRDGRAVVEVVALVGQVSPDRAALVCDAGLAAGDPLALSATDEHLRFLSAFAAADGKPTEPTPS